MPAITPPPARAPRWWPLIAGVCAVVLLAAGVVIALNILRFISLMGIASWTWQIAAVILVASGCYFAATNGKSAAPSKSLKILLSTGFLSVAVSFFAVGYFTTAWICFFLAAAIALLLGSVVRVSIDTALGYTDTEPIE